MRVVLALFFCGAIFAQTPSAQEQAAALDAIRSYARSYTQSLPDYVATQTIRRDISVRRGLFFPTVRNQTDTVEEEILYAGSREIHRTIRVNGQEMVGSEPVEEGLFSQGEFGALLATIFDPASAAEFRWNRAATLDKRRVYVFDFRVPDRPAGYSIIEGTAATVVGFRGSVYADMESKAVLRIQMTCTGIPSSSAYRQLGLAVDYALTEIAGREFMLPARYTLNAERLDATLTLDGRYKDYRRFAADSKILLDSEQP